VADPWRPGPEAEKGRQILSKYMGEKGDGDFTLVAQTAPGQARNLAFTARVEAAARRAATEVKGAKAGPVQQAGRGVVYVQIPTPLEAVDSSKKTSEMRKAIGASPQGPAAQGGRLGAGGLAGARRRRLVTRAS